MQISDEMICVLNDKIDETTYSTKQYSKIVDWGLIEQIYKEICAIKPLREKKRIIEAIEQSEMFELALDFFKSIGGEFYEEAKSIIENRNKNISLELIRLDKNDKGIKESHAFTDGEKTTIYILEKEKPKDQRLAPGMYSLDDLSALVHEISHTFDIIYTENEAKNTLTRQIFAESTAIAFEDILTKYLIKNTNFSLESIVQMYNRNKNDLVYLVTMEQYIKLQLSKEKEKRGSISREDILSLIESNNLSPDWAMKKIKSITRTRKGYMQGDFMGDNKYALALVASPQIIKLYEQNGPEGLKTYIEAVKGDDYTGVFKMLGFEKGNVPNLVSDILKQDNEINTYKREKDPRNEFLKSIRTSGVIFPDNKRPQGNENKRIAEIEHLEH